MSDTLVISSLGANSSVWILLLPGDGLWPGSSPTQDDYGDLPSDLSALDHQFLQLTPPPTHRGRGRRGSLQQKVLGTQLQSLELLGHLGMLLLLMLLVIRSFEVRTGLVVHFLLRVVSHNLLTMLTWVLKCCCPTPLSAYSWTGFRPPLPFHMFHRAPFQWGLTSLLGMYPCIPPLSGCLGCFYPRHRMGLGVHTHCWRLGQFVRSFIYRTHISTHQQPLSLLQRWVGLRSLSPWSLKPPSDRWCWAGHRCFTLVLRRYFISGQGRTVPSPLHFPGLPWSPVVWAYIKALSAVNLTW